MANITIGLAHNRAGFYDRNTNINLSLSRPAATVEVAETDAEAGRYLEIFQSVYSDPPVLVLIDGTFPDAVIRYHRQLIGHTAEPVAPIVEEVFVAQSVEAVVIPSESPQEEPEEKPGLQVDEEQEAPLAAEKPAEKRESYFERKPKKQK